MYDLFLIKKIFFIDSFWNPLKPLYNSKSYTSILLGKVLKILIYRRITGPDTGLPQNKDLQVKMQIRSYNAVARKIR